MDLDDVENAFFRTNGYLVVGGLLAKDEVRTLRRRADEIAAQIEEYRKRDDAQRLPYIQRYPTKKINGRPDFSGLEMVRINKKWGRLGERIFPLAETSPHPDAVARARASEDPWDQSSGPRTISQLNHLVDNDALFGRFAAHPTIIAVLTEILSDNVKVWFDHLYNKPPFNSTPPYFGANRYHQDGFFHLSKRSVTCWIALDELTEQNGCLRYVPLTAGYGQFRFDKLGNRITEKHLEQEVRVTLQPGDAVFHDRWTIHATGPNETAQRRRGWALHYADAESVFGNFADHPDEPPLDFIQTDDRIHLHNGIVRGNLWWRLVAGRAFAECI